MGRVMGIKPTIFGTTTRRFNQLSYTRHTASHYTLKNIFLLPEDRLRNEKSRSFFGVMMDEVMTVMTKP